jgi:UDP-N-acetylglucosamine--N-acetylmuramyl-(pentapeptide) pyrophosphoryl-undecaprenol N-acetylglucosamine transferase
VLVPYPYATADHQRKNARWMVNGGAALLVDDHDLTGETLRRLVHELLRDPARLAGMAAASAALGRPDATQRVVDQMETIVRERGAR